MKRRIPLTIAVFLLIIFTSCTLFGPTPSLSEFSSTDTDKLGVIQVETDETFTLTVSGSTMDSMSSSDLTDYSGTITISSSPAGIVAAKTSSLTATFDTTATDETFVVSFPTAGDYSIIATLTASNGVSVTKTLSATVAEAGPWAGKTITSVDSDWFRGITSSSSTELWYSTTVKSGADYTVYYLDDGDSDNYYIANISDLIIYDSDGTILDDNEFIGPSSEFTPSGSTIYIKVTTALDTGAFYMCVSSTDPYETITTSYEYATLTSSNQVEVYKYVPSSTTTAYFKFEDDSPNTVSASDYTLNGKFSVFIGTDDCLFGRDTYMSDVNEHSVYLYSTDYAYYVVEGYYTSSIGTYCLNID